MVSTKSLRLASGLTLLTFLGLAPASHAGLQHVTVTIKNLAPANSVSFAPLRLGFGNGTFDSFNNGQSAGTPPTSAIISVAEGGSGSAWFPAFAAAEPAAITGSVGGALLPGASASSTFTFDTANANNRFFTFANMVIPSNDRMVRNLLTRSASNANKKLSRNSFRNKPVLDCIAYKCSFKFHWQKGLTKF